jgi:CheY-like chemotaxis protein
VSALRTGARDGMRLALDGREPRLEMTGTCPERKAVLVVDDDEVFLRSLLDGLAVYPGEFRVVGAHDGATALAALAEDRFDLLLTDLRMPGIDGFELVRRLAQANRRVPLIVMTALGAREIGDRLDDAAPLSLLDKPLDFEQLLGAIRAALELGAGADGGAAAPREPSEDYDGEA